MCVCARAQLCPTLCTKCPTLCDPMDCSLPCSSAHGIFQARILGGLPFPAPEDLLTQGSNCIFCISCIGRHILHPCITWEVCICYHTDFSLYILYIDIYFLKYSVPLTSLSQCFLRIPFTYLNTDFWFHMQVPLSSALLYWFFSRSSHSCHLLSLNISDLTHDLCITLPIWQFCLHISWGLYMFKTKQILLSSCHISVWASLWIPYSPPQ